MSATALATLVMPQQQRHVDKITHAPGAQGRYPAVGGSDQAPAVPPQQVLKAKGIRNPVFSFEEIGLRMPLALAPWKGLVKVAPGSAPAPRPQ